MSKTNNLFLTVIMPALNEGKNILSAIDDALAAFKELSVKAEILVINDGSSDSTPRLVEQRIKENPGALRMLAHESPKGIGASFWDGVDNAKGNVVCMLPGDNENEPQETIRYLKLLEDVDIVVPFVFNKTTRSLFRNFLSFFYRCIINVTFCTSLNYTNGTVLYRKSLLKELSFRRKGFFYQTDILIRLLKKGYLFAEVPYRLRTRRAGKSKAVNFKSLKEVIGGYLRLVKDIYLCRQAKIKEFVPDSVSAERYGRTNSRRT